MRKIFLYSFLLWAIVSCKERFDPPVVSKGANYLVVEGLINSGQEPTNIQLSRTVKLSDSAVSRPEFGAQVSVEGSDNTVYKLLASGNGLYSVSQLNLNNNIKYRLHIKTADGKEYVSDFVPVKTTPDIDSLSWQKGTDAVQININTHDPKNNTFYYRWEYTETWEYHSIYESSLVYRNGLVVRRDSTNKIYKCWHIANSSSILLGSSAKLGQDIISEYPLMTIPDGSEKTSIRYSILVKQYALTKDAYDFWTNLKKNTEQLGSIFDAQPSVLMGNIHCVTNPQEVVVGYIGASSVTQKRLFISIDQLMPWHIAPLDQCEKRIIPDDSVQYYFSQPILFTPIDSEYQMATYIGISTSTGNCIDCREKGGTNVKPPYWP